MCVRVRALAAMIEAGDDGDDNDKPSLQLASLL
jgi:hypothetical protein